MTIPRLAGLLLIFIAATVGWAMLCGVLALRTSETTGDAQAELGSLWGPRQNQLAPQFHENIVIADSMLPIDASSIDVNLSLDQRRKGLLWFNTYTVRFAGTYRIAPSSRTRHISLVFPFPAQNAVYDDVRVLVNGRPVAYETMPSTDTAPGGVTARLQASPHQPLDIMVTYGSQGTGQWSYEFGSGINEIRNFDLVMHTNFDAIDFPEQTLSPAIEQRTTDGWRLEWRYRNLVAGRGIGMAFPERLQPGPVAERITAWAPLSLAFYFFVMFVLCTIRRIDLHPMHFLFLAAAFFAFHLLFAYTVDRLPLVAAFALCSIVSMCLTISYLRIVVGLRFAALEAGLAQFVYLILFSLALFNEGFSGLAITIGAILTLFVTMQLTARLNWSDVFARGTGAAAESHATQA